MPARKPSTEVVEQDVSDSIDVYDLVNKQAQGPAMPMSYDQFINLETGELVDFVGSPWKVIQKEQLMGREFIIADVRVYKGKYGEPVAAVMCVTPEPLADEEGSMYVFNDGSTGVYEQVVGMIQTTGKKTGIRCKNGLRKSEYTYEEYDAFHPDAPPKLIPATTYYIA